MRDRGLMRTPIRLQGAGLRGRSRFLPLWILCVFAGPAGADFAPEVLVTEASGSATQTAMGLDLANNAYISSVIGEKIRIRILGPSVDVEAVIPGNGLGQGDPDFATNARADTYLVFSQLKEDSIGEGREIYLTHNVGGQFAEPIAVTENRVDEFAPRMDMDSDGIPHLTWARRVGEDTRVLYMRWDPAEGGGEEALVGEGDYPAVYVDNDDVVHLVYSRNHDLFYNTNEGGAFTNEARVSTTPFEPEYSVSLGGDPDGNIVICYESKKSLYFVARPTGEAFQPPQLKDRGGVLNPRMRVRRDGKVSIVYSKEGDIYFIQGQSTVLNLPQQVTDTPEVESHPSLDVDLSNNIHLSYVRGGAVYYTTNASAPTADFSALPTIGEVPLKVKFADLSSGDIQVWRWDFGDGTTSTSRNPEHTYLASGKYTVTLEVSGPGAVTSTRVREDYIFIEDPFNTLRIPNQVVYPTQKDVWFPVIAAHREPLQAFQVMATYDPNVLTLAGHSLTHTDLQTLSPELFVVNDRGTRVEVGCMIDVEPPHDGRKLPAGDHQAIMNLIFNVSSGAPQGATTQISLVNNREVSNILNIFTVDGTTKIPALTSSTVEILVMQPPYPRLFLRGDVDGNGSVEITDAIRLLNYLFLGGDPPTCLDAADVADSGSIDISGAISILNYLFLGGRPPAIPFPNQGLDPTEDRYPRC